MSDSQWHAFIERAHALNEIERYTDAVALFENALALDPDSAYVMTCIAWTLRQLGDYNGCKEYAERAIQSDPEFQWPYRELAQLRLLANDIDGAYKLATTAVQLETENINSLHLLGHCAFALDRHEEVRFIAAAILEIDPDEYEAHELLSFVAAAENDHAGAVRHLQRALDIEPENALLIEQLANAQQKLRRSESSAELFEAALHADPHDRNVQTSLRDSIYKMALFGERNQRLRSPAAWCAMITMVYLGVWFFVAATTNSDVIFSWLNRIGFFLLPVLFVASIVILRRQFIDKRFPQLAFGYQMLRQQARREYLIGIPFVIVCLVGISVVLSRGQMPPVFVYAPVWMPIAMIWLAIFGLIIGLVRSVVIDRALGDRTDLVATAEITATWNMIFEVVLGLLMLVAAIVWSSRLALVGAVGLLLYVALSHFPRRPYLCATIMLVMGLAIARLADHLPMLLDLHPALLGFILMLLGIILIAKSTWMAGSRFWQRRRIKKALAQQSDSD